MGMKKFKLKYAPDQTDEFVQSVVDAYRKVWAPGVPKLWRALNDAVVRTVWDKRTTEAYGVEYRLEDGWLSARLPSGRKIWYWKPEPTREVMPWDEDDVRRGVTYWATKNKAMRPVKLFGGLLAENVVMGIERDIMVHGRRNLEREGFPVVFECYDEAMAECYDEDTVDEKLFAQCLEDVPAWCKALRIPVAVELWKKPSRRYHK
jgi:DNA polymerase